MRQPEREAELTGLSVVADSNERAAQRIQELYSAEVRKTFEAAHERSNRFDEETSFSHDPERQREWAEQIARELEVP